MTTTTYIHILIDEINEYLLLSDQELFELGITRETLVIRQEQLSMELDE